MVYVNDVGFCVKGYNQRGDKDSIDNSFQYESLVCAYEDSMVSVDDEWVDVSVFGTHTCAIGYDNNLYCWGENTHGQLGDNSTQDSQLPVAVDKSGAFW